MYLDRPLENFQRRSRQNSLDTKLLCFGVCSLIWKALFDLKEVPIHFNGVKGAQKRVKLVRSVQFQKMIYVFKRNDEHCVSQVMKEVEVERRADAKCNSSKRNVTERMAELRSGEKQVQMFHMGPSQTFSFGIRSPLCSKGASKNVCISNIYRTGHGSTQAALERFQAAFLNNF